MTDSPPHPGKVLRDTIIKPLNITITEAARCLAITRISLSRVLNGKAGISAELALRLEMAHANTAQYWINLQIDYDLWRARQRPQPHIEKIEWDFPDDFNEPILLEEKK